MLSKEEEHRLAAFFVTDEELEVDVTHYSPEFYINAVRWLAEKLKETNDELKLVEATVTDCEEWHQNNR